LRERITVYGGELDAGPRPGGGWRLAARIPLEPPVAARIPLGPPAVARIPLGLPAAELPVPQAFQGGVDVSAPWLSTLWS
jgi:hypothetical protein